MAQYLENSFVGSRKVFWASFVVERNLGIILYSFHRWSLLIITDDFFFLMCSKDKVYSKKLNSL